LGREVEGRMEVVRKISQGVPKNEESVVE
jgi:hypothetical protein